MGNERRAGRGVREVVVDDPKVREGGNVHGHDHDPLPHDPKQTAQPGLDVPPVVHGENGHRGIDSAVGQGEILDRGLQRGSGPRRPLGDHDGGRLDRENPPVGRLIGARARAHVHNGLGIAKGCRDLAGKARVWLSHRSVSTAQSVVGGLYI
jgi:hypothetical protein